MNVTLDLERAVEIVRSITGRFGAVTTLRYSNGVVKGIVTGGDYATREEAFRWAP